MTSHRTQNIGLGPVRDFHAKDPGIYAILVDRLWPRGTKKESLPVNLWARDWAPSSDLRHDFHEGKIDFSRFRTDYIQELQDRKQEILAVLESITEKNILLLFASRDQKENNAAVLKEVIDGWVSEKIIKH
jgi:uncharacterized protein YeaO (DUF488 family)